ncbi:MFS transporter [Burkholderia ambifaria]|uniref:MFS transporter n=1 Tax=Burkholderia ambifaria TaxID=152480 RepID=UPI00158AD1BF|nr:MFS transporter [Burkholderia ambifaria]
MTRSTASTGERSRSAHPLALTIILGGQLMIVLDGTVIYTALPQVLADLSFSAATLSWVQNAYLLGFGGFMLLGARTGDMAGHRRVFLLATTLFVVASVAVGIAPSASWLVAARGIQGIAAAFTAPSILALLMSLYTEGPVRARALMLHTAISGGGSALGLIMGGLLTSFVSWRATFLINLPIGTVLLVLGQRRIPAGIGRKVRVDLVGALAVTLGMGALVYGLVHAAHDGAQLSGVVVPIVVGVVLLATFVWVESCAVHPIMPLRLFRNAQRAGAYLSKLLLVGGMLGTFFFLTQYVQRGLGFSALEAGAIFLPLSVAQCLMVLLGVPKLMPRLGSARMLMAGLSVACIGMLWLSRIEPDTPFLPGLVMPIVLLGLGTGAALVPLTILGVAGVGSDDAGAASGLVNITHYLGGALGTAVMVCIARWTISPTIAPDDVRHILAHALSISAASAAVAFLLALFVTACTMRR